MVRVSQQALSPRFLTFPAEIFDRIFKELLPEFERKWHSRKQRLLPRWNSNIFSKKSLFNVSIVLTLTRLFVRA